MADGIETRGNSVRVYFVSMANCAGSLCPVAANREQAARLVNIIEYEIQAGILSTAGTFPTLPN
jgi:integrase